MNIQGMLQQIGNIISSANSGAEAAVKQAEMPAQPEVQNQQAVPTPKNDTNVKMDNQDSINSLLKELSSKLAASQKTIDNMPDNLKNQIRQMLSERTSLADMRDGMANMVQNQKQSLSNLGKLAESLENIAKFLAEAENAGAGKNDKNAQLPLKDSAANTAQAKEAVQEKISSQLLKELLDSIVTKPNEQAVKAAQQPDQGKDAQNAKQQPASDGKTPENSAGKEQVVKEGTSNNQTDKLLLKENINNQQANNMKSPVDAKQAQQNHQANQSSQAAKGEANNTQQTQNQAKAEQTLNPQQQTNNSLLSLVKNSDTGQASMLKEPVTAQDIVRLSQNLNKVSDILKELMQQKPELARAMQTLENNPANLSSNDKAMLHSLLARIIKDTFKSPEDANVLNKAMGKLATKESSVFGKDMSDLQAMNKLLKNTESLQHSKQQVQEWANSLREIATGMAKTTNLPGEKTTQHLQTSFVFCLAGEDKDKNQPVYINIYHEKEKENANGLKKPAETWLRVNVNPEHVGDVTAIFHLYQENLLDVKVIFAKEEGMKEFSRFVPSIQNAMKESSMQINSILVV